MSVGDDHRHRGDDGRGDQLGRSLYSATVNSASSTGSDDDRAPAEAEREDQHDAERRRGATRWRSRSAIAAITERPAAARHASVRWRGGRPPSAPMPMTKITSTGPTSSSRGGSRQPRAVVSGRSRVARHVAERTTGEGAAPPSRRRIPPHPSAEPASARPSAPCANMCSMRWSNLSMDEEERARLPGLPGGGGRAPFRGAGRDLDPVLRGPGQVDPQPGAGGIADAVPVDDQSLSRLHARLRLLPVR